MTEDHRRQTYQDFLRKRGIDLDAARKEREKAESGCVIRSLQSALGAQATEEEWELRLRDVRLSESFPSVIPVMTAFRMDLANIWTFIMRLATHDTPLGQALQAVELEDAALTGREIKSRLKLGEKVCVIGGLVTEGRLEGFHMAHIELDGETAVSRSDQYTNVELEDDTEYLSLVFYPKNTEK